MDNVQVRLGAPWSLTEKIRPMAAPLTCRMPLSFAKKGAMIVNVAFAINITARSAFMIAGSLEGSARRRKRRKNDEPREDSYTNRDNAINRHTHYKNTLPTINVCIRSCYLERRSAARAVAFIFFAR
jgi:hypothetical protein